MNMQRGKPGRTAAQSAQAAPKIGPPIGLKSTLLDGIATPQDLRSHDRAQLPEISDALRNEVIDIVSETGGHLGAGLGVVELTVALHFTLDTPQDKIIWDVSHQCYPHKVLTGRRAAMRKIRKGGGLSGFTNRRESVFDPFGAAHSSTAISAGLGFATARDFKGENNHVVAIVGDGAITGGMAYEGLNNAGAQKRRLITILNDNNMSIAPPAGALQHFLTELRGHMPNQAARNAALKITQLPSFAPSATLFDDLGVHYAGPFDGHDVDEMVTVLEQAKAWRNGPVLIHVITEKGKGYAPAMESGCKYHGVSKFDITSGVQEKTVAKAPSYTSVFAKALIEEAKADDRICAISAAMPSGTGLDKFGKVFPDRTFDAGIAEQHAVTFCGGLACEGMKPFAAIYSTFLQRGYDQIVHDIAIQRLPVRFAIDRAGMVGADGVTHQGSYDIAYLGCLPGFVLMAPSDEAELMHMVATAAQIDDRPSAFRYPRGEGVGVPLPARGEVLPIGRGRIIQEGSTIALLSYGTRLQDALAAAEILDGLGFSTTVADARFAKPIDDELVACLFKEHAAVVSIEEGSSGGFASLVLDSIARQRLSVNTRNFAQMYLPDFFIDHDSQVNQIARAHLDATSIVARAIETLRPVDRRARLAQVEAGE
ncbi:MAG: 1-deoxy-D-xylulose-5-phosphate synthase [Alphaproteobacteria bacterium]|nr:1-deoxy-D-xylulose-5-phosphate synthase [Alphaproteobacteria bacterium]